MTDHQEDLKLTPVQQRVLEVLRGAPGALERLRALGLVDQHVSGGGIHGDYPPSAPEHVGELLDHIARLEDEQIDRIRRTLDGWADATRRDESQG